MSNVVRFAPRPAPAPASGGLAALLQCFAQFRRREGDAFWLKENAELLSILAATGQRPGAAALAPYADFHAGIEAQIAFYPQYYRMLLGITLSLEALGMPGDKSAALADWIVAEGLIETEVNDLQRAESRYLLARAGQQVDLPGLDDRLLGFLSRPATFALPNPRAGYDLLHVVFYLSHYGQRALALPPAAQESLMRLGNQAWLDQNGDLLAEVCLALHFAGLPLPALWRGFVVAESAEFRLEAEPCADSSDAYHNFLVNRWLLATIEESVFGDHFKAGPMRVFLSRPLISPLREWSQALLSVPQRRADWGAMRAACAPRLSPRALAVADQAAAASPGFADFFAEFARAGQVGPAPFGRRRVGA